MIILNIVEDVGKPYAIHVWWRFRPISVSEFASKLGVKLPSSHKGFRGAAMTAAFRVF